MEFLCPPRCSILKQFTAVSQGPPRELPQDSSSIINAVVWPDGPRQLTSLLSRDVAPPASMVWSD